MTPYQSQRVRFGILAARHELERHRLTPDQVEDLEGMEFEGWQVRDSTPAYDEERKAINARRRHDGVRRPGELASRRRNRR